MKDWLRTQLREAFRAGNENDMLKAQLFWKVKVQGQKQMQSWGFKSWRDFVESEMEGMHIREVERYIQVWKAFGVRLGMKRVLRDPRKMCVLRELAPIVDGHNVEELWETAKTLTNHTAIALRRAKTHKKVLTEEEFKRAPKSSENLIHGSYWGTQSDHREIQRMMNFFRKDKCYTNDGAVLADICRVLKFELGISSKAA